MALPAEQVIDDGQDVQWFAALEVDACGLDPFAPLLDRFAQLDAHAGRPVCHWWTYMLDDGRTEVTTGNRLRHITMGQNLATDFTLAAGASHLLFLAADLEPPHDAVPACSRSTGRSSAATSPPTASTAPVRRLPVPRAPAHGDRRVRADRPAAAPVRAVAVGRRRRHVGRPVPAPRRRKFHGIETGCAMTWWAGITRRSARSRPRPRHAGGRP